MNEQAIPSEYIPPKKIRWWSGPAFGYFLLPVAIFVFTSIPGISDLTPVLALVALVALVSLRFTSKDSISIKTMLWTFLVLALVGSTGWFFSPFFFALYLIGIVLGFVYTPIVAGSFTLALLALFTQGVGEVDPTYDFFTLISLLSVLPITISLRKSFLLVQQQQKGILILESDAKSQGGVTSLDTVLSNQVNHISILLRQPITYLKQGLSLLAGGKLDEKEYRETLDRMRKAADELVTLVKQFERGTTKNVLVNKRSKKDIV